MELSEGARKLKDLNECLCVFHSKKTNAGVPSSLSLALVFTFPSPVIEKVAFKVGNRGWNSAGVLQVFLAISGSVSKGLSVVEFGIGSEQIWHVTRIAYIGLIQI